jgi:hypothetical protein
VGGRRSVGFGQVAAEFEAFLFFCRFWFPADNDFHRGGAFTTSYDIYSFVLALNLDIMSFRKRNVGLSAGVDRAAVPNASTQPAPLESSPGIRPSPDDGRPTTSTGAPSLDNLLAGHAGLPMGKILLIEENGTTDFAGALLRYYAAEGVVQEQKIHVVGVPEQWGRSLPGLTGTAESLDEKRSDKRKDEKMKIAWRYERLGEFGAGVAGSRDGEYLDSRNEYSFQMLIDNSSQPCASWRTRYSCKASLLSCL